MKSSNTIPLDLIVFGASGYTGKRVVEILHELTKNTKRQITWGIAGRNYQKLEELLTELEKDTGDNLKKNPIIVADTENESSLEEMASKCRIIVNCTGPYKYHGEPVVRACIRQKCHYVDINAEPLFVNKLKLLYNEEASKNGVYIVPNCGLDSIPGDVGLDFVQKQFSGTLNSVETYFEVIFENGSFFGVMNPGTLHSLLLALKDKSELKKTEKKLFEGKLPDLKPKLSLKRLPHKVPMSGNLACPFPGTDATVITHSQLYFYEKNRSRPVQVHTYIATSKTWVPFFLYLVYPFLCLFSKFNIIKNLFVKYSQFFTAGVFKEKPTLEVTKNCEIVMTLYGKGWKNKVIDEHHQEPEDSWIVAKIRKNDGYFLTAICVIKAALVMLDENQKVPEMGGVYTPASFYSDTNLVDLLRKNGIKFEVCGQGDL